ncbi:MAG: SDR family NAD(P)-dependent oxidoreductase, partial [Beijerinckiaceae bacterium]
HQVATATVDVRDAEALSETLLSADASTPIDILIANAGLGGDTSLAGPHGEDPRAARHIAAVNFQGVVNTLAPLAPVMAARGRGRLAVISSLAAEAPLPLAATYAASKAGAASYARNLRLFLAPKGVYVTLVLPGFVDTPMSRSLAGPRPGLWSAEKAAHAIIEGIERGKAVVAFPLWLRLAAAVGRIAPAPVVNLIQSRWRKE